MERESFEDATVADKLNAGFVAVKVDREERPDVDSIYMSACQSMTGSGGWPLTILMTPEKKPFFAATYLPRQTRANMLGLIELLDMALNKWDNLRKDLEAFSQRITAALSSLTEEQRGSADALPMRAFRSLKGSFDAEFGGFGGAPKFPMPHNIMFLLRFYEEYKDAYALRMAEKTLIQMYRGGIFDHIGFGFSRYSTDERWLVPHFEKMLYDNALLVIAYIEAYRITNNELYKAVAQKTICYVMRELTDAEGGFLCAQDADSDGVEGKYYVFEPKEIVELLGEAEGEAFNRHFDITEEGNFEGRNIPNLLNTKSDMEASLREVYEYRKTRNTLHKDDKSLTSWNGLMIAALAMAYGVLGTPEYLSAAVKASAFIETRLADGDEVFTSYRDGKRSEHGFLDDYAFYIWGLTELYRVTLEERYLSRAVLLAEKAVCEFWDSAGGFFIYGKSSERLFMRPKEFYDGALPSGNSVMALNLITLSRFKKDFEDFAQRQISYMTSRSWEHAQGASFFMYALMSYLYPPKQIICVPANNDDVNELAKKLDKHAAIIILKSATAEYPLKNGLTTYYVCENNRCLPPVNAL